METGQPSRTAWGAATHRAVHQVRDGGRVFRDPLAVRILGAAGDDAVRDAADDPATRRLRLLIVARAAFAETTLAASGVDQLVVLGAGLDTTAYRRPAGDALRVFEVDHPATQAWKRQLLADAGIAIPSTLAFAPCDFERDSLLDVLRVAGFDGARASMVSWLGVVPYLTEDAIRATLGALASLPGGAHVVLDYPNPRDPSDPPSELAARVARLGEAFRFSAETDAMHALLAACGFRVVEDLGPAQIAERYAGVTTPIRRGGHLLHAAASRMNTR